MLRQLLRRLAPRRKTLSPVEQLRQELSRTVGYFSLRSDEVPSRNLWSGNVVVYGGLKVPNEWPEVTSAHEQAHFRLINSTPFGLFCKLLEGAPNLDKSRVANLLAGSQWTTQEAAATYIGLGALAADKDRLDRAVSSLPSAALDGPPYREAFDLVDELLPLENAADVSAINANIIAVEAMATWALSSDILTRFKTPAAITEKVLTEYLAASGPDSRFNELASRFRHTVDLKDVVADVSRTISATAELVGGFPDSEFWLLISRLQDVVATTSTIDLARRTVIMGQFARAWSAASEAESVRAWNDETPIRSSEWTSEMLPEVVVGELSLTPLSPGLVDLTETSSVELGLGRAVGPLEQNARGGMALFLAVVMPTARSRVFFRPTVYRTGEDGVSPDDSDMAMIFLVQESGPIHVCDADTFADVVAGIPFRLSVLGFFGHSWSHWHLRGRPAGVPIVATSLGPPFDDGLGDCVRVCMEINLSFAHLMFLLAGVGLNVRPEYFLFSLGEAEHVACLLDRHKPDVYLLQLLSGEIGYNTFEEIARQEQFRRLNVADGSVELPHLELLTFLAKALLVEAATAGRHRDVDS